MKFDNVASWAFVVLSFHYLTATGVVVALDPKEEGKLNFTQIAHKMGLECEEHDVVTEDGYVLKLFHLPGDRARPVFLLSGNLGSADDYIARENTSLPAVLAAAGYDVWAGNWRGCKYGRRHLTLDPDRDTKFWDYSIHEYGKYDAAAHIDYVLNQTKSKRVACIGWSMGTMSFYVLGALRPEYSDKVAVVVSLAPIGYLHHYSQVYNHLPQIKMVVDLMGMLNINEIAGESAFVTALRYVCSSKELGYQVCMKGWFFPSFGYDSPSNLEPEFLPILFGHFPSGISRKSLLHLYQIMNTRNITQYDYGRVENTKRYGRETAPLYPMERNNMNVVLISAMNDVMSTLPDVELLKALLPNVADHVLLEPADFTHYDFTYGRNSHEIVYKPQVLKYLKKFL